MTDVPPPEATPKAGIWPPGVIQDWLPAPDAAVVQHKLRVLGRGGVVAVLGALAQRGPLTLAQVTELAQLQPTIARTRLHQLTDIGILTHHPRHGYQVTTWELNHDAMLRTGSYFIRPATHHPPAGTNPDPAPTLSADQAPGSDQPDPGRISAPAEPIAGPPPGLPAGSNAPR